MEGEQGEDSEILLFYVDENGENEEGVITTIESIQNGVVSSATLNAGDDLFANSSQESSGTPANKDRWSELETQQLLVFFLDNKETFISGVTKKKHLWTVACKTMLPRKTAYSCELKLRNLKRKYANLMIEAHRGKKVNWVLYDLCRSAFSDDPYVKLMEEDHCTTPSDNKITKLKETRSNNEDGVIVIKEIQPKKADEKVMKLLKLYLQNKNDLNTHKQKRNFWDRVAVEIGEEDGDYWHKRFFNFHQHYLRLLDKRHKLGIKNIDWPYMKLFDEINKDNKKLHAKFTPLEPLNPKPSNKVNNRMEHKFTEKDNNWIETEKVVLVKYYFDCLNEFEDPTIPKDYLWSEVGRLLDKKAEVCMRKYEELKTAHIESYMAGSGDLRSRRPLQILFDTIISKETELALLKVIKTNQEDVWTETEVATFIQYFYDNIEMFKDSVCFYVCWAIAGIKLNKSLQSLKKKWYDLAKQYHIMLEMKKDSPDLDIQWDYMEIFDRLLDYGMDNRFLELIESMEKKVVPNASEAFEENLDQYDVNGFPEHTRAVKGDQKAFKILEYYGKNKDKFNSSPRRKLLLWAVLAKEIGLTAEQCAHRFRNLKQVYTNYVQRELCKPEMPIVWPYYPICKKVFGYKALKNKLKADRTDTEDEEEWTAEEIKTLISYCKEHINEINSADDENIWSELARDIGRTATSCGAKFLELRRYYRVLKTMRQRDPEAKFSWKYFTMMDNVFKAQVVEDMDVDYVDDEEYQIIIVPDSDDLPSAASNEAIILTDQDAEETEQIKNEDQTDEPIQTKVIKWKKSTKLQLLKLYYNYVRSQKGKVIDADHMWEYISSKLPNKTPLSCRLALTRLKNTHIPQNQIGMVNGRKYPYHYYMEKILSLKPKFAKRRGSVQTRGCKDVDLPEWKVEKLLVYYLDNLEELSSPKFDKYVIWRPLAAEISEPVAKIIRKVNFMKKTYNVETNLVNGQESPFGDLMRAIKQSTPIKTIKVENKVVNQNEWSEDVIELLLKWYLENLENFKDPKFVTKFLWREAANVTGRSAIACSKKMSEIRSEYRSKVKASPSTLQDWRFYELCKKIYGTGKKNVNNELNDSNPAFDLQAARILNSSVDFIKEEILVKVEDNDTNARPHGVTLNDIQTAFVINGESLNPDGHITTEGETSRVPTIEEVLQMEMDP